MDDLLRFVSCLFSFCRCLGINFYVFFCSTCPGEARGALFGSSSEALAEGLIGENSSDAGGDTGYVLGIHVVGALPYYFWQTTDMRGDDRRADGGSFESRQAEAFVEAREEQCFTFGIESGHESVGYAAGEDDVCPKALFLDELGNVLIAGLGLAGDDKLETRMVCSDGAKRRDGTLDIFVMHPHADDEHIRVSCLEVLPQGVTLIVRHRLVKARIDAFVNGGLLVRPGQRESSDVAGGGVGDGNNGAGAAQRIGEEVFIGQLL